MESALKTQWASRWQSTCKHAIIVSLVGLENCLQRLQARSVMASKFYANSTIRISQALPRERN